jgi:uncharacterized phage protein (TIGR01671 family)
MREILFRAKQKYGKRWIEGQPVASKEGERITLLSTRVRRKNDSFSGIVLVDIDPSTLCQFTGRKDSAKVNIWEGDKLATSIATYIIRYSSDLTAFIAESTDDHKGTHLLSYWHHGRVIGSIHDTEPVEESEEE